MKKKISKSVQQRVEEARKRLQKVQTQRVGESGAKMSMVAKPEMRVEWHNLIKEEGLTPEEIATRYNEHPVVVVKTLRKATPKIKGANYKHLPMPIPIEEIKQARYAGTLVDIARKYGVSMTTINARWSKFLMSEDSLPTSDTKQNASLEASRKQHTRKIDKITEEEKVKAVNAYYQSGRKLNCTTLSTNILKQILEEQGVPEKNHPAISTRYVVRLMDAFMSINPETRASYMRDTQRLFVNFTSDNPLVWKGQVLDLLFTEKIDQDQARDFSSAIDLVALHIKMGNETNADY